MGIYSNSLVDEGESIFTERSWNCSDLIEMDILIIA